MKRLDAKKPTAGGYRYAAKKAPGGAGVVAQLVHAEPAAAVARVEEAHLFAAPDLIEQVQGGLATAEVEALRDFIDLPMEKLLGLLGISKATYHRRKAKGRLVPSESDHVVRFARLTGRAVEVLETLANARLWLRSPQTGLGDAVPLDYATTEVGAREVEDLLGRIDCGVYA